MASKKSAKREKSGDGIERGKPRLKRRLEDLPAKTLSAEHATNVKGGDFPVQKHIAGVKYED